jgi:hypothetical protein
MNTKMDTRVDALMDDVRALNARRARARQDAVRSIRALETRLVEVLDGTSLRGLPNLALECEEPFNGIRLRGKMAEGLPFDGRAVLVLSESGRIKMAMRYEDGTLRPHANVVSWDAADADFRAEDLEQVIGRVAVVLEHHAAQAKKTSGQYAAVSMLALRLTGALRAA